MSLHDVRMITVCVDYWDILALTLPHNLPLFQSVLVVTSMRDSRTLEIAQAAGADVFQTNAFFEREAAFNRFKALELGLDYMGRCGWICIAGADIAFPRVGHPWTKKEGNLYRPLRHIHPQIPKSIPEERKWRQFKPPYPKDESAGYAQIFHADDPVLRTGSRWFETTWSLAGGGDTFFERRWPVSKQVRPPLEVLHIGEIGQNWAGRVTAYADGSVDGNAEVRRGMMRNLRNRRRAEFRDSFAAEKMS